MSARTAIILAGGRSRRFGVNKALHEWRGRSLLDHVRAAVAPVCERIVVVGGPSPSADLADDEPGAGPVAALRTAFAHLPDDQLFLTACDLPLLTPEVVRAVAHHPCDDPDAVVVAVTSDGRPQPVVARYPRAAADVGATSLFGLLGALTIERVTIPGPSDWAVNANRLSDLPK